MKNVGLYFGSFNPVHVGHLVLANHMISHSLVDEIWFVISPQNPLKDPQELAPEQDRLHMLNAAIRGSHNMVACDVEFGLGRPSYTSNTLRHLRSKHSDLQFTIVLGEDIKTNFHLWKDYEWILEQFPMFLYPRHNSDSDESPIRWSDYRVHTLSAPRIEISSTVIRADIKKGLDIRFLIPDAVIEYIREHQLYQS
ncbi:MAG: nicotinate-nucleotide adenylyltransferase [Flavobacteriales bacterium]|nr:nicotinate-nucleotide adenylyltransferase [Flavobacteriales bacterium]